MDQPYDAILVVSFGGPEKPDDVMPFLENVVRGKNVPRDRLLEVAAHYQRMGGASPINDQCRALIAALERELAEHGPQLPVYWGNRNWHPLLPDTLGEMAARGVRRAVGFFTTAFSSYSSCRQYLENIAAARQAVGPDAPTVDKLRAYYNHPGFIEATAARAAAAIEQIPSERRAAARLVYTAHSIPLAMAAGCRYADQLSAASRLVGAKLGRRDGVLVYQSRSGPPGQPWLEPDVCDCLRELAATGDVRDVVVVPIGFVSDHVEVLFDLDTEARAVCDETGLNMVRAETVGVHPAFVNMIRDLVVERVEGRRERPVLGADGPSHDVCPAECCPSGRPRG